MMKLQTRPAMLGRHKSYNYGKSQIALNSKLINSVSFFRPSNPFFAFSKCSANQQSHRKIHSESARWSTPGSFKRPKVSYIIFASSISAFALWVNSTVDKLESSTPASSGIKQKRSVPSSDKIESVLLDDSIQRIDHLTERPASQLLSSYLTYLLCEVPGVVIYGPKVLDSFQSICKGIPFIGGAAWGGAEWLMRQTFFAHYTGGESPEDCLPVLKTLLDQRVGTLLNYSVEGPDGNEKNHDLKADCQVSQRHIDAILIAVQTASKFGSPSSLEPVYPPGSLRMRPTTLAIKVSGLVTDPYIFKRASDSLNLNHISPYKTSHEVFPRAASSPDPLSDADRSALEELMEKLRDICKQAKSKDVTLMIDAEYSWFQPALDRLATTLCAEFNSLPKVDSTSLQESSPTVYNTFQALLRSTPERVDEFIKEAEKNKYSVGIKLVRGAYLVSETEHWKEEKEKTANKIVQLPVWGSKEETDNCFDLVASKIVNHLSNRAKNAERMIDNVSIARGYFSRDKFIPEVCLMIAGHNVNSIAKILKQLRDVEKLAKENNTDGNLTLCLSDALRGRLMFAQLYGMADCLTGTVAKLLESPSSLGIEKETMSRITLQPFVHKYLPYGPICEVMPYLARRAEENQSMLQNSEGRSAVAVERKLIGQEIRRRVLNFF
ncbi:FAD-linked oxidoreductase-like protein, partial [Phakopsora pachyrhizi]